MPKSFEVKLFNINSWTILKLPQDISEQLPSRGQIMAKGTINDVPFQAALEPDGDWGHWLNIDEDMQHAVGIKAGDTVTIELEPTKDWPEPKIPADVQVALDADAAMKERWLAVTPMARWEWLRWIGATASTETRQRRIEVAGSKLLAGERRPCCFNRNMCCVPQVSKNGMLLKPAATA